MQYRGPGFCATGETFNSDTFFAGCLLIIGAKRALIRDQFCVFSGQELLVKVGWS